MTMMEWAQETRARDTNSNTTHSYTDTHTDSLHDRPTHTREKGGWPPSEREDERERRRNKEREATTTRRVVRPSCVTSASVRQWWAWLEQETKRSSHNDGLNCPGYAIFFRTPSEYGEDLRFVDRSDRLDSLLERSSSRSSVVVAKEWSSGGQRSLVSILLGWWWLEARSLCIRWHGWCSIYRTCCWIASSYCNRIVLLLMYVYLPSNPIIVFIPIDLGRNIHHKSSCGARSGCCFAVTCCSCCRSRCCRIRCWRTSASIPHPFFLRGT